MDERRVDRDPEGGEQPRRAAAEPPAEKEDDEDRGDAEQRLDDPRRPFPRPAGRVEGGGVEQRRARRPVAGVLEFRPAVAPFVIERLGERVVGARVVGGVDGRLGHRVGAQAQAEDDDRRQREQRPAPVARRQRAEPVGDGGQGRLRLSGADA